MADIIPFKPKREIKYDAYGFEILQAGDIDPDTGMVLTQEDIDYIHILDVVPNEGIFSRKQIENRIVENGFTRKLAEWFIEVQLELCWDIRSDGLIECR